MAERKRGFLGFLWMDQRKGRKLNESRFFSYPIFFPLCRVVRWRGEGGRKKSFSSIPSFYYFRMLYCLPGGREEKRKSSRCGLSLLGPARRHAMKKGRKEEGKKKVNSETFLSLSSRVGRRERKKGPSLHSPAFKSDPTLPAYELRSVLRGVADERERRGKKGKRLSSRLPCKLLFFVSGVKSSPGGEGREKGSQFEQLLVIASLSYLPMLEHENLARRFRRGEKKGGGGKEDSTRLRFLGSIFASLG